MCDCACAMPRAKKGLQKVPILNKTIGLCPSRSYYSMKYLTIHPNTNTRFMNTRTPADVYSPYKKKGSEPCTPLPVDKQPPGPVVRWREFTILLKCCK